MKIRYNAPIVLTFTFLCVGILIIDFFVPGDFTGRFFAVQNSMRVTDLGDWWRLFGHVLGHADMTHLIGNLAFLLLLGPVLEEKWGSFRLLEMILITAGITGLVVVLLLPGGLMGASGIVFMMVLLGSFVNVKSGEIPLTFILVGILFLGREIVDMSRENNIPQIAHLLGGACGAAFGMFRNR